MGRLGMAAAAVVALLVTAGCSGDGNTVGVDVPPPTASINADGPDPAMLVAKGTYWLFTTSSGGLRIPVRSVTKDNTWSEPTEALAKRPVWSATDDDYWAPGPVAADGGYVLWFAAPTDPEDQFSQCIGYARSASPDGPYEPVGDQPVICLRDGPAVDPFPWRGPDGQLYLAWTQYHYKSGKPTQILASALDDTGTKLVGKQGELLTDPTGWESIIIENPALFVDTSGSVRLLYSGNFYFTAKYATGTATCSGPLGPCERDTPGKQWFASTGRLQGPGGMAVFTGPSDETWTVFHAWGEAVGYDKGGRRAPHLRPLSALPPLPHSRS